MLLLLAVVFLVSACAYGPVFVQNVHAVVPGTVYRSAQLSGDQLNDLIADKGIKSILNLRGAEPESEWYREETAAAQAAGIEHLDFALSSKVEVPADQAKQLIDLMKKAPKPMLIHCWAGADRTGLASALYLYGVQGEPAERAVKALSMRYHHFSFTSAGAMDRSFAAFTSPAPLAAELAPVTSPSR